MIYITLPYLFVTLFAVWQYRHQLPLWLLWCYVPVMICYGFSLCCFHYNMIFYELYQYSLRLSLYGLCLLRPFNGYYVNGRVRWTHLLVHICLTSILCYLIL